jgi:hypothetical protein
LCLRKYWEIVDRKNRRWTKLNTGEFCDWQVPFTEYYWDDHLKEDEMGRACGTHGTEYKWLLGIVRLN